MVVVGVSSDNDDTVADGDRRAKVIALGGVRGRQLRALVVKELVAEDIHGARVRRARAVSTSCTNHYGRAAIE